MADDQNKREVDVVVIGDVVTDDFIKLLDDQAMTYTDEHGRKVLAMEFGTKLPFDHREVLPGVGNAGNAAAAMARIGLNVVFVTDVGGDTYGREIIHAIDAEGADTRYVRIHPKKITNYHFVLWYKEERTILIKHENYDYHWPHFRAREIPRWVYFTSISEHSLEYHDDVAEWLEDNPDIKLAFQPGTFQIKFGADRLKKIYQRTEVLLLNREEAVLVGGGNHEDMHDLINHLHALGPKIVVVTDGPNGAYASDGTQRLKMPIYPDIAPPYERTGAGDAFSSTFVAALAKGNTIEGALQLAPINSMSVVQKVGGQAGLLNEHHLEEYLKKAPDWYHAEPF